MYVISRPLTVDTSPYVFRTPSKKDCNLKSLTWFGTFCSLGNVDLYFLVLDPLFLDSLQRVARMGFPDCYERSKVFDFDQPDVILFQATLVREESDDVDFVDLVLPAQAHV